MDLQIGLTYGMTKASWDRVPHQPPIGDPAELEIVGLRNEVIGAQVRLYSDQAFVLLLDRTNWLHPLGFCPRVRLAVEFPSLPADAVEPYAVGYVEGDDHRQWMETLDRAGYAETVAYRTQAAYLRICVPKDLAAGTHVGTVTAWTQHGFEDEVRYWQGTIRLQIADLALPDVADWSFHLDLWQHYTAIARYHHVPLWSDAHFCLIDAYMASLSQLGQKALTVIAAEIPWSGQRCFRDQTYPAYLYEHAIVEVSRDPTGALHLDLGKLDRLLALAAKHGIDQEIEVLGLLNIWVDEAFGFGKVAPDAPDAIRVRCYDQESGAWTYLRTAHDLATYVRALRDALAERELLERTRITADEPSDLSLFRERLAFLQDAAPEFKYKVAINHYEFMEDAPAVADAVPTLALACRDPALTSQLADKLHAVGGRLLWYICCHPPVPNTFLHSPLVEGELIGWLTYVLRLDGFLRWAFCLWPAEPWQRISWRAPHWNAGDMYFVLPGKDGAPVETLRYEALRAAAQDYELLALVERTLVERRQPPDQAQAAVAAAVAQVLRPGALRGFADPATAQDKALYSLDPQDYQAARRTLIKAIESLANSSPGR
jgi:hypothetical protein